MKYDGLLIDRIIEAVEKVQGVKLVKCKDCEFEFPDTQLVRCKQCEHIACAPCMEDHASQPHLTDSDNSPQAHGAWRFDA